MDREAVKSPCRWQEKRCHVPEKPVRMLAPVQKMMMKQKWRWMKE
jgi:hypothetical protein